jgi:4-hydroxy-tetrahydrodipicolinate synthase
MTGFVPALGTPLDCNGKLCVESYKKQIDDQIKAGAAGILAMGSMGIQPYLTTDVYPEVAKVAVEAAAGRVPVYVGAMDTSIARAKDRMAAMEDLDIAGFVFTTPYYYGCTPAQIINYYKGVAAATKKPILMYDLAVVTKTATAPATVKRLWKNPLIKGIKSGNLVTQRILHRAEDRPEDFTMMYSNIDDFDIAYKWGINKNLDGMFACTPTTAKKMYTALAAGDYETGAKALDDIIALRNMFLGTTNLMSAFTHAMNLLGCEGCFTADYVEKITDAEKEQVAAAMKALGEI